jgi:hypothetical protein
MSSILAAAAVLAAVLDGFAAPGEPVIAIARALFLLFLAVLIAVGARSLVRDGRGGRSVRNR